MKVESDSSLLLRQLERLRAGQIDPSQVERQQIVDGFERSTCGLFCFHAFLLARGFGRLISVHEMRKQLISNSHSRIITLVDLRDLQQP